jgi:hypothetical protein
MTDAEYGNDSIANMNDTEYKNYLKDDTPRCLGKESERLYEAAWLGRSKEIIELIIDRVLAIVEDPDFDYYDLPWLTPSIKDIFLYAALCSMVHEKDKSVEDCHDNTIVNYLIRGCSIDDDAVDISTVNELVILALQAGAVGHACRLIGMIPPERRNTLKYAMTADWSTLWVLWDEFGGPTDEVLGALAKANMGFEFRLALAWLGLNGMVRREYVEPSAAMRALMNAHSSVDIFLLVLERQTKQRLEQVHVQDDDTTPARRPWMTAKENFAQERVNRLGRLLTRIGELKLNTPKTVEAVIDELKKVV